MCSTPRPVDQQPVSPCACVASSPTGRPSPWAAGVTDADGRIAELLEGPLEPGVYRLTFEVHEYRPRCFFREVTLELGLEDVSRSYHVPLLVAPYGVSSYRGS